MKQFSIVVASLVLAVAGCKNKDAAPPAEGSGSATAVSGGSGLAAGSDSTTPEGSASAGGGSGSGSGGDSGSAAAAEPATHGLLTALGFPNTELGAEAGQWGFAPDTSRLKGSVDGPDHEKGSLGFGVVEIKEVGPIESKVAQRGSEWMVPNAFILPFPKGATLAKGDLVAASRYGNSLDRAYVTADGDQPKANFMRTMPMDKDYAAELKPDQFVKLDGTPLQPGSAVGMPSQHAGKWDVGTVYRIEGDQVLVAGHMGKMAVFTKDQLRPVPVKVDGKKGDKVYAVWDTAHFMEATLEKIDDKRGLYQVRLPKPFDESKQVPFGELAPALFE